MNTQTTRLRVGALGLTLATACMTALPAYSQDQVPQQQRASKQENIGVTTGFAVGAAAAGPVGAVIGAAAGAWLGDRYHKQATTSSTLTGTEVFVRSMAGASRLSTGKVLVAGGAGNASAELFCPAGQAPVLAPIGDKSVAEHPSEPLTFGATVQPGLSKKTRLVFDVPPGVTGLVLEAASMRFAVPDTKKAP